MGLWIIKKLLSSILTCVVVFGILVVLVDEGPIEMPYYDYAWQEPVTSPQLDAMYHTDDNAEPRISSLPQTYAPADAADGQEYKSTTAYAQ